MSMNLQVCFFDRFTVHLLKWSASEDTFILLDALEADAAELQEMKPRVCLEIGCISRSTIKSPLADVHAFASTGLDQDVSQRLLGLYWVAVVVRVSLVRYLL